MTRAGLPVVAENRELRLMLKVVGPRAEIVAKPRRFRLKLGKLQLVLPNGACALHVLALRKRQGRIVLAQRCIDEQGQISRAAHLVSRSVAFFPVRQNLHVEMRLGAERHRPQDRVGVVRVNVVIRRNHESSGRPLHGDAGIEPAQTSVCGVPRSNCNTSTRYPPINGMCMWTCRMP